MSSGRKVDFIHSSWTTEAIESLVDNENGLIDPRIYSDQGLYFMLKKEVFNHIFAFA